MRKLPKMKEPHHKKGESKPMCIRYQVTGKCKSSCRLSHSKPSGLSKETKDEITVRLQGIYKEE